MLWTKGTVLMDFLKLQKKGKSLAQTRIPCFCESAKLVKLERNLVQIRMPPHRMGESNC